MIALIPARGGSKGLPNKNIKRLDGKPLISYTIESAKYSRYIKRIIVSTDDIKIANVAKDYKAEIPFLRPPELATDSATTLDVIIFTMEFMLGEDRPANMELILLQPTSPLRTADDIDQAIELYYDKNADSVISVSEAVHPPTWAKKIGADGILHDYFPVSDALSNRQQIEKAYMPNGAIYVLNYALLKEKGTYYSDKTYAYIMPRERSVDIDDQLDFEFAEYLMRKKWRK